MNSSVVVIGLVILLIGLFIPIMYLGLVLLFAIVLIIIGLCMESEEQKIRRKRRICRICGKRITKEQAESLGLCQACFKAEFREDEIFGEGEDKEMICDCQLEDGDCEDIKEDNERNGECSIRMQKGCKNEDKNICCRLCKIEDCKIRCIKIKTSAP